jgi:hypothetical protein
MIHPLSLSMLAVVRLSLTVFAQDNKTAAPVQIRAVLHDPVNPIANLFYTDKTGARVQLNFRPQALTDPIHRSRHARCVATHRYHHCGYQPEIGAAVKLTANHPAPQIIRQTWLLPYRPARQPILANKTEAGPLIDGIIKNISRVITALRLKSAKVKIVIAQNLPVRSREEACSVLHQNERMKSLLK